MTVEELLARIDPLELTAWQVLEVIEAKEYTDATERAKTEAAEDPGMEVHVLGRPCDEDGHPIDDDEDEQDDEE